MDLAAADAAVRTESSCSEPAAGCHSNNLPRRADGLGSGRVDRLNALSDEIHRRRKPAPECRDPAGDNRGMVRRREETDAPFRRHLCTNCERPCGRRSGHYPNEIAPLHTHPTPQSRQHTHRVLL
jgi:hypothetical protein